MCIGIVLTVVTVVWIWLVYGVNIDKIHWKFLKPQDKKAKHVKKEISVSVLFVADIVITVVVVIGVILGIVGFIVCKGCNSTNDKEHTGLILAIIGFIVVVIIALLAVIVLTILIVCGIIRIKKSGKRPNQEDGAQE
ncbi:uncharacterized protein LOC117320303, partial [Pecten maximus]|uniref:uncharacterized protein LOC117320303 n=1 Tax=Pecten maximus TaxID=6579 RepID=UPI001458F9BC